MPLYALTKLLTRTADEIGAVLAEILPQQLKSGKWLGRSAWIMSSSRTTAQRPKIIVVRERKRSDVIRDQSEGITEVQLQSPVTACELAMGKRATTARARGEDAEPKTVRNKGRRENIGATLENLLPVLDSWNAHGM